MSVRMSSRKTSPVAPLGTKSSPAGVKGGNKSSAPVSGSSGPTSNEECHWVQCDRCDRWELFENRGIPGNFDETRVKQVKFECRLCAVNANSETYDARIVGLEQQLAQVMKVLDLGVEERMKAMEAKLVSLESRIDALFWNW